MNTSSLKKFMAAFGLAVVMGTGLSAVAMADDWDRRDHWDHERHEHEEREWREHEWRERHYVPPPVVYAYPQQGYYYAPPPVVTGPSGLNIILPLNFR